MKWNRGRQLDSYKITISVKDIVDILDGKNKRLIKNSAAISSALSPFICLLWGIISFHHMF